MTLAQIVRQKGPVVESWWIDNYEVAVVANKSTFEGNYGQLQVWRSIAPDRWERFPTPERVLTLGQWERNLTMQRLAEEAAAWIEELNAEIAEAKYQEEHGDDDDEEEDEE